MSEGANAELIRKLFADANRVDEVGGVGAWLDFFSEEMVWEAVVDAPDAGTYRGHEGIRGYLEDWFETVDGLHNELRGLTELGAGVVADIRFSGRIKGTESEMTFDYSQASLIENGRARTSRSFASTTRRSLGSRTPSAGRLRGRKPARSGAVGGAGP